ncbi:MAG: TonB-dependent receptor [Planctomycetota bacterium]
MRPILSVAALLLSGSLVSAQEEERPATSPKRERETIAERPYLFPDEIVVTATSGVPLDYPGGRYIIGPEAVARHPSGTLGELMRRAPGVYVPTETGTDSKIQIGLRGLNSRRGNYTTFLIDGVPMSQAPYGETDLDIFPITLERVHRIDFIRGGASVRYGPNTVGGVINLETSPIPKTSGFRTSVRYGSDADYSVLAEGGGTWDKFGALATGVWKGGDGFRENGDYWMHDYALKTRYTLDTDSELTWNISKYDEESDLPGGLTQAAYDQDPDQSIRDGDQFKGDREALSIGYFRELSERSAFRLNVFAHDVFRTYYLQRPTFTFPFTDARHTDFRHKVQGIEGTYTFDEELLGVRNTFMTSSRFVYEDSHAFFFDEPVAGGPNTVIVDTDFGTRATSFYAEDAVEVTEDVTVTAGGRLEFIAQTAESDLTGQTRNRNYDVSLGSLSAVWRVTEQVALFADAYEAFRTPRFFQSDPSAPEYASDLDPENATTYEAGVRATELEGLEGSLTFFRMNFRDQIVATPSGGITVYQNIGKSVHEGVELDLLYALSQVAAMLEGFSVYFNYTAMHATVESGDFEGNDAPNSPRWLTAAGIQYEHPKGIWARIDTTAGGDSYADLANTEAGSANGDIGENPAWNVWNVSAGHSLDVGPGSVELALGATNIFDDEYFLRFFNGILPAPGRRMFATLGYTLSF